MQTRTLYHNKNKSAVFKLKNLIADKNVKILRQKQKNVLIESQQSMKGIYNDTHNIGTLLQTNHQQSR